MEMDESATATETRAGSAFEVFRVFLVLGLTSFGGPVAHLGYFRDAFVVRRRWLDERAYADLVALCQFLPGPASSQVGMAIGLMRAGAWGALAAWLGFTLPSAIAMVAFAGGAGALTEAAGTGWIAGLKAAAVAVVANAVVGMATTLAPDRERATIAAVGMIGALLIPVSAGQAVVIVAGGLIGLAWLRPPPVRAGGPEGLVVPVSRTAAATLLAVFLVLLLALPVLAAATTDPTLQLADSFYRAGSLVFGGGHVVLPLLEAEVVGGGLVDHDAFLAGYGAAQAVPGPLFTFAAYLGAVMQSPAGGLTGAAVALVAIFAPSMFLVAGTLPFWGSLRNAPAARRALAGVNAAVVGLLAAALYDPVFTAGITSPAAMAIAAAAFVALAAWKVPAWAVVVAAASAGYLVL